MLIDVRHNLPEVKAVLQGQQRQIPFALSVGINWTAQAVRDDEQKEMRAVFDRPTDYTLRSLYLKPSTKTNLKATVWVKDTDRPFHYLLPQIHGGDRPQKRMEYMLTRAGFMRRDERAVPGSGARLDAFGNVSRGQIQQVVSQLRAFYLAGAGQNASASKRSRAKRLSEAYFVSTGAGTHPTGGHSWINGRKAQHLPRGIWVRRSFGTLGTSIKPVFLFVPRATYRPRFRFFEVAEATIARVLPGNLRRAAEYALQTARPGGGVP